MSATEKKRIASLGGEARRRSLQAARRIVENLRYAAVLDELGAGLGAELGAGLGGRATSVRRLTEFAGPLPGIDASGS